MSSTSSANRTPAARPEGPDPIWLPAGPTPPGRIKIMAALRALLEEKDFGSVTTAEIARTAGVTEALIYKYFKDKRDLLYELLAQHLDYYSNQTMEELKKLRGTRARLRQTIRAHLASYAQDRIFAKMLLLEVRGFSDYYASRPYKLIKKYSRFLLRIIKTGIKRGDIPANLSPEFIRHVILGGIEHHSLTKVIFNQEINPDELADDLCRLIFPVQKD